MGGNSKRDYLFAIHQRYTGASKTDKGLILKEFCAICGYHRKHAIRLLNRRQNKPRKPTRPKITLSGAAKSAQTNLAGHRSNLFEKTRRGNPALAAVL